MKILHLSAQKPDFTGSGIYLAETVAGFARRGCEQAVVAGIGPGDAPEFPEGVRFCPVRFETPELPFAVVGMSDVMPYASTRYRDLTPQMVGQFKAAFSQALNQVLDSFAPDVVVCHHLYLLCGVAVRVIDERRRSGAMGPCTVCGLSHSTDIRQMRQIPLERAYIRAGVGMLDRILALHSQQAGQIVQVYGVDPRVVEVVGTGYNQRVFHRIDGLRRAGTCNLVYVGKVCEKKGVRALLGAVEALRHDRANLQLVLVGGHSDAREYDRLVAFAREHGLPATFAGRVGIDDLVAAYNTADVFVLPSFYEGLPLVVVEALACGCKVVVTDLPGIRPWVASNVPDAPVEFVEPPRMRDADTPHEHDLPAFEKRLAAALERSLAEPLRDCDTTSATWDALCGRILEATVGR